MNRKLTAAFAIGAFLLVTGCKSWSEIADDLSNAAQVIQDAETKALFSAKKACAGIQTALAETTALATDLSTTCKAKNLVTQISAGIQAKCDQVNAATAPVPFSTLLKDISAAFAAAEAARANGC